MTEGPAEYGLPISGQGVLRLVPRLRERYLSQDVEEAVVQASGAHLRIWLWSDRENIVVEVPFEGLRWERPYERSVHRWGINVNRWLTTGKHQDEEEVPGWWNDTTLEVDYQPEYGQDGVEAVVRTHDRGDPRA